MPKGSLRVLLGWFAIILLVGSISSVLAQPPKAASAGVAPHTALVNQYCITCHNSKLKVAGLQLDAISADAVTQHPEEWEKVIRKLRGHYMPPPGSPRPDDATYTKVLSSLVSTLNTVATSKPNPGRTSPVRRLTRTEYQNSIRDLLGIDMDVTPLLPADELSHGFDNITVAGMSPTLLEKYLNAAEKVSRLAVGGILPSPGGDTMMMPPDRTQEQRIDGLPLGLRGGGSTTYNFPVDAEYELQFRLDRDSRELVAGLDEPTDMHIFIDRELTKTFKVIPAEGEDHSNVDKQLNLRMPVKAGPHTIAVAFGKNRAWTVLPTERQPYQAHFNMDRHPRTQVALYTITVNGPYGAQTSGDTPSRRRIFVCRPGKASEEEACAKRILTTIARRAYRRPVNDADMQVPMKFYRDGRADNGFESGVESGLASILVSPEFIFRVEADPPNLAPGTAYKVSDLELAGRLSFFLWSSIPDDELLNAATSGKLRTPAGLEQQVRRMLGDARSRSLVNNFASQWLYLRNLAGSTPDMRLFPDFDDNLRQSLREETELFFDSIMRNDRPIPELLSAKYTFVNERLAKHYGIPNIYGSQFRRIEYDGRGGLLRHGSVLMVTSYATRTSPVIRGKWVLENILGVPPPPPPPAVPPLKDNTGSTKGMSVRERLGLHRANMPCAGCHRLMDPVGFALENFDAVGRWRSMEEQKKIDSSGSLPDGSTFQGIEGLQTAIMGRQEQFVSTFTDKLMTYAIGRAVEYYDQPSIRSIVADSKTKDYRFSSVVLGIVNSTPFQMRRTK